MIPKRIQRKRILGWKMPENTVYVGRPTIYGNPFKVYKEKYRHDAIIEYRKWVLSKSDKELVRFLSPLKGKDLACWCKPDQECHADVLLELANKD